MSQPPDPDKIRSKTRETLDRSRLRAGEVLTDVPLVEDFLQRADARSKTSAALRESLAPLHRLIRSCVRGSYRDAPAGDVAWALAAVMYVASPLDTIPDYLPGGLRDDKAVAASVLRRIAPTIRAYETWEASIGENATGLVPSPFATLSSPAALDFVVLGRMDSGLFNRLEPQARRTLPPIAANPALVGAAQSIQGALAAGQVVRVVGPPEVLQGLAAGTLEWVPSTGGHIGLVRDVATKEWVSNARFGDSVPNLNPALAGFQFASALTLQYYLARIDRQLGEIDRQIRGVRQDSKDIQYGRIESARKQCELAERVLAEASGLGDSDTFRLELAAHDLDQTYEALAASVSSFCERVEGADFQTVSKHDLDVLLKDGSGAALTDIQLFVYAAVVRHRIGGVQAFLLSAEGEYRSRIAHEDLEAMHQEMVALLIRVRAALRKLNLPKRALDERFPKLGGPERSLAEYSSRSEWVRALLSSPEDVLPAYTPQEPFVMDLRLGEGQTLEAEWAYVRRTEPAIG